MSSKRSMFKRLRLRLKLRLTLKHSNRRKLRCRMISTWRASPPRRPLQPRRMSSSNYSKWLLRTLRLPLFRRSLRHSRLRLPSQLKKRRLKRVRVRRWITRHYNNNKMRRKRRQWSSRPLRQLKPLALLVLPRVKRPKLHSE